MSVYRELIRQIELGNAHKVKLLLGNPGIVNTSISGWPPAIVYATMLGQAKIVNQLLSAGALADALDGGGKTALHWACEYGRYGIAKSLLQFGANAHFKSSNINTPVELAILNGHARVIKEVLKLGLITDKQAPVNFAMKVGQPKIAKLIIEFRTDTDISETRRRKAT